MKCPQCHYENKPGATECDSCAVIFKDTKRGRSARSDGLAGQSCAWNDHGRQCPCKGIISSTTNGGGSWYCREHWESINDRTPSERGNALPVHQARTARAGVEVAKRRELQPLIQWAEGETYAEFRRRARAERDAQEPREPGSDDEWADLVPEAAGQP